jgi:hypothetical protein
MRALRGRDFVAKLAPVRPSEQEQLMKRMSLVAIAFALASAAKAGEKEDEAKAKLSIQSILTACEAYEVSPQNKTGAPPKLLLELVKPPFGGASFLRNGVKDLIDPWGKMFRYDVAKDEKGRLRAYAWIERTVGGKLIVIGTKPPRS